MVDADRFWTIVDDSRQRALNPPPAQGEDILDRQIDELRKSLSELPPDDVAAFDHQFSAHLRRAYRWDIWGVAYWLGGGCSDDGFLDFRSCLISLGKERYVQVLEDPDSIVDFVDDADVPYMQSEGFQYVTGEVYEEMTGEDVPLDSEERQPELADPAGEKNSTSTTLTP